jgi:hypothetical protein
MQKPIKLDFSHNLEFSNVDVGFPVHDQSGRLAEVSIEFSLTFKPLGLEIHDCKYLLRSDAACLILAGRSSFERIHDFDEDEEVIEIHNHEFRAALFERLDALAQAVCPSMLTELQKEEKGEGSRKTAAKK